MQIIDFIKNNRDYFEDLTTRSTYHSNAIEGNTLSFAETYAIIFNDNSFKINAQPREIYEAINHKYAFSHMLDLVKEDLTQKIIIDIAVQINKNISEISGYRSTQVFIRNAEFIPSSPINIPQEMMYFVHNYNNTHYDNIYEKIAEQHIKFERIHPFSDGNGRTGRILINFELLKNNLPPVIIPLESRTDYFRLLSSQDVQGLSNFLSVHSEQERERIQIFEQAQEEEQEENSQEL